MTEVELLLTDPTLDGLVMLLISPDERLHELHVSLAGRPEEDRDQVTGDQGAGGGGGEEVSGEAADHLLGLLFCDDDLDNTEKLCQQIFFQ